MCRRRRPTITRAGRNWRRCAGRRVQAGVDCEAILGSGNIIDDSGHYLRKEDQSCHYGTSALHGLDRIVFDSTTEAVLRQAPCPVLTVGPRAINPEKHYSRMGQSSSRPTFTSSPFIDPLCCMFLSVDRSPLHCLHVMPRTLEAVPSARLCRRSCPRRCNSLPTKAAWSLSRRSAQRPMAARSPVR